ncbi:MAG: tRNA epoxyqueuosine(34) reductase QueG [Flavobacteriaceae bacterium]|nr:tRNA epoxyqueuosine(34) reductase QueG [Flavobacteriaceae bacterium]
MNKEKITADLKAKAQNLGFLSCGISKADFLEEEAPSLERWLNDNHHGKMAYMERNFDKRLDPRKLVSGAKSVVSLTYNYYSRKKQSDPSAPKIAMYTYGEDYHRVIKKKLRLLLNYLHETVGDINGRVFVDSAPVMERQWAQKSGLGWQGKNTLLLNKKVGSYFFIAELIIDLELQYDGPTTDHCGTCTACIDACPTQAIYAPYKMDARKCISYLTIELRDEIPFEFKDKMENWAFGCDICQQVCPWNKFAYPHNEPAFEPESPWLDFKESQWQEMTQEVFNKVFKNSALKRTKFKGLKRNLEFLKA